MHVLNIEIWKEIWRKEIKNGEKAMSINHTRRKTTIKSPHGVYTNQLIKVVQKAQMYQSKIYITVKEMNLDAKSILFLVAMRPFLNYGEEIVVSADGVDAGIAVKTLCALI